MTDIVERLRMERRATAWRRGLDCDFPTAFEQHPLCQEAADEITRLRAEAEALRKDAERYRWLKERNVTTVLLIAYSERAACEHDDPDTAVDAAIDATKGTT